jgi:Fe-S cluster biogenesis protein NfuA
MVADGSAKSLTTRERIEAVLNRIRPLLQADGIRIALLAVRDTGADVQLTGLPVECVGAPLNFQTAIEIALRDEVEGFDELRLVC